MYDNLVTQSVAMWVYFLIGMFAVLVVFVSFLIGEVADFFQDSISPFSHDSSPEFSRFVNGGSLIGFVAGFGLVASLSMAAWNASTLGAAGWGLLGGLVMGAVLSVMYMAFARSSASSTHESHELVGRTAQVTQKIFANSVGEVRYQVRGAPMWQTARTQDGREVEAGSLVKITQVVGNVLVVEHVQVEVGQVEVDK